MKKKIPRMVAFLLALVLTAGLASPASAAVETYITVNGEVYNAGKLVYDYNQVPAYMKHSFVINALQYIGYDAKALAEKGLLFHPDYLGPNITNLDGWEAYVSHIPYAQNTGVSGHTIRTALSGEKTKTGNVPDVEALKAAGLACTTFLEYMYFGYARNVEGPDVERLLWTYEAAQKRPAADRTHPDLWTETMEGTGGAVDTGVVKKYSSTLQESIDQTKDFRDILKQIHPGTMIRFGKEGDPYVHWGIYIGTYNNQHYVAHQSSDRGPEISSIETVAGYESAEKRSYPLAFYDLEIGENRGDIQVIKTDAATGNALAGAWFIAVNQEKLTNYTFGPTSDTGVAIISGLPLGTYSVREITAPAGYAISSEVQIAKLTEEDPVPDPLIFANTKLPDGAATITGSLAINKNTNTGTDKGGWQFKLYNNRYWHAAAIDASTSGRLFRVMVMDKHGNSVISKPATQTYAPMAEANDTDYIQITKQPLKYKQYTAGATNVIFVEATGTNLTYTWQYSQDKGATWKNLGYGNYARYSAAIPAYWSGTMVRCKISDAQGHVVHSDPCTFVLKSSPLITEQPQSTSVVYGGTAVFRVAAASTQTIRYQWQYSSDGGTVWEDCTSANLPDATGTTSSTLTLPTSKMVNPNYKFRCKISDTDETIYSDTADLDIEAVEITAHPQDYIGSFGDTVTFTVAGGTTGSGFYWDWWECSDDGGLTWKQINHIGSSLTLELNEETNAKLYRARGSCLMALDVATYSEPALLLEENTLYILEQPKDVNAVVEGDAIFYAEANGEGLCYIWQTSTDGGNTWVDVTLPIGTYTTDENGNIQIDGITCDDYFVWEVNDSKEGWIYDTAPKTVTVTVENTANKPAQVSFYNEIDASRNFTLPDTGIFDLILAGSVATEPVVTAIGVGLLMMLCIVFFPRFHRRPKRDEE